MTEKILVAVNEADVVVLVASAVWAEAATLTIPMII